MGGSVKPYADIFGISAKIMTWLAGTETCASKDICEGNDCMENDGGECVASVSTIVVAVSDVAAKITECGALTGAACTTAEACSPSGGACELSMMHGIGLMFPKGKPMYKIIETAFGCSAHVKEGDCSGNCALNSAKKGIYGDNACDITDNAAMDTFLPPKCDKVLVSSGNRLWPATTWIVAAVLLATLAEV